MSHSHGHPALVAPTSLANEPTDPAVLTAIADLQTRVAALEAAAAPAIPPGAVYVTAGATWPALTNGIVLVLRAGTHKKAFGSTEQTVRDVTIMGYPGESVTIDGTGLDQHFVYLGPSSGTWKLTDLNFRNFFPTGSGVFGIGDGCRIEMTRVSAIGKGAPANSQDQCVYFHGTGTGLLVDCNITNFPAAALQSYRGTPDIDVTGGVLGGKSYGVYCYSGHMDLTGVDLDGGSSYDIDIQLPASATLSSCTGNGANGAVRTYGPHS